MKVQRGLRWPKPYTLNSGLHFLFRFPYMGDCQNYSPFLGPYYNTGPSLGDPKRDHNFDNPPHNPKNHRGLQGGPRPHLFWVCIFSHRF